MANESVAQSYLAVVLKKPAEARAHKQKVWGELYDAIFNGSSIEPYIIAVKLVDHSQAWLKQSGYTNDPDDVRRKLASSGKFFIARIASFLWRNGDRFNNSSRAILRQQIAALENNPQDVYLKIQQAFERFEKMIRSNKQYLSDLDKTLKSVSLDAEIDRLLRSRTR